MVHVLQLIRLTAKFDVGLISFQASKFVVRFNQERRNKLSLILDSERWRQADVPAEFQALVGRIHSTGESTQLCSVGFGKNYCDLIQFNVFKGIFSASRPESKADEADSEQPSSDLLRVGNEAFAVVG